MRYVNSIQLQIYIALYVESELEALYLFIYYYV